MEGAADLDLLRDMHDSVVEARKLLPLGRGNVVEDIKTTHGLSAWADYYRRVLPRETSGGAATMENPEGAATVSFGAGNCSQYAYMTALTMASRMGPDVAARNVGDRANNHAWTETAPGGNYADRDHTVVGDGWCGGPALFARDHSYTLPARLDEARDTKHWSVEDAGRLAQVKREAQLLAVKGMIPPFPKEAPYNLSVGAIWNLDSGVNRSFTRRVAKRLGREVTAEEAYAKALDGPAAAGSAIASPSATVQRPPGGHGSGADTSEAKPPRGLIPADLRSSIQAVQVARTLAPNIKVKALAEVAPKIVKAAETLDKPKSHAVYPFDEPPVNP